MEEPTQEQIEMWAKQKEISKKKRWNNHENAKRIFADRKIEFTILNESCSHFKVGEWNFWGTTGLFININTKERGRGVFSLIKKLKNE